MAKHTVTFLPDGPTVEVPTGTLISEAVRLAGLGIAQPCGGQGRCGRCAVIVEQGQARRRSTMRLSPDDLAAGHALACQTVVEGDLRLRMLAPERIERRLVTDKIARKIELPFPYDPALDQSIRIERLELTPPTLQDNIDDLNRIWRGLAAKGYPSVDVPLPILRRLAETLRQAEWSPWAALDLPPDPYSRARLVDLCPEPIRPIGLALDIGTTTMTAYLVDLTSGQVMASAAEYNGQIAFGEDVISRIIYAGKNDGLNDLSNAVRSTLATLLERLRLPTGITPDHIHKVSVAGNTTMIHLFLGLPPAAIRLTPYIPTANQPPTYRSGDLGLPLNPDAVVDCMQGVASYVGADITAGVLACGLAEADVLTLFIDVGTNGEMVLGTRDWMVTCACSAGPAFEGAGVVDGMRATEGAIEEVWVSSETYEPTYRVIGDGPPRGLCGSGLISLLAELFVTGVIDRAGNVKLDLDTPRVRQGEHGPEYVVAWADQTQTGRDIVLTKVDVDNLLRAKAAIYAGFIVLATSVGVNLADVQQVLVGGSFGKYINVEKAIQIGLLPDLPWDRFHFLGNTAVMGAYMTLLSREAKQRLKQVARMMTYIELSADNAFYEAFTAALFLPHTEIARFPSVAEVWERNASGPVPRGESVTR
ncbi:MAG: ASKHA domain-containing protein [Chloroflexota bacterium]